MGKEVAGYTEQELGKLYRSAKGLLGREIQFNGLQIEANVAKEIDGCVLDSRNKVAIAISAIDFYPTQSANWQQKIDKGDGKRRPLQIYSDMSNANPLVSVTLQKTAAAKTTPLAVIKRVIAATGTGKGDVKEVTWKELLTNPALGLLPEQMKQVMDAMNYADIMKEDSGVRIQKIDGTTFASEQLDTPEGAHEDLDAKIALTRDGKSEIKEALLELMKMKR